MRTLMRSSALDETLKKEVYQQPALIPAEPWLGSSAPGKPKVAIAKGASVSQAKVTWSPGGFSKAWLWLVQTRSGEHWTTQILPAPTTSETWANGVPAVVAVSAVDRKGNISSPAVVTPRAR